MDRFEARHVFVVPREIRQSHCRMRRGILQGFMSGIGGFSTASTFDMSGWPKASPLDGRVRRRCIQGAGAGIGKMLDTRQPSAVLIRT